MTGAILIALVPVFFVLLLGYGAGRLGVTDSRQVDGLNVLVMDFALPASLFAATASASRSEMYAQAPLFAVLGLIMLVVYFAWYGIVRAFSMSSGDDMPLQAVTIAFPNMAGVGLPIAMAVLGPGGAVSVAMALASGSLLVSPLTLVLMDMSHASGSAKGNIGPRILIALGRAVTKPIVLAPALGILVSLLELRLGPVVEACLLLIGHSAAGTALFLTGLVISSQPFRLDWRTVAATALADIARPLLTAALVLCLPISTELAKACIILSVIPAGFFGILFAVNYKLDPSTTGSMVLASTLMSIITLPIAIIILFH